ncbi:hypothetical protein G6F65_019871 [Rhizopus arrhizus]|nr:hypothetical protein G6F65_019871 [Rhizopus arrhizus]
MEAVRLVGPITPMTKRGLSGVVASTASQHALGLADRSCVEGIGLDQVRTGFQVGRVDVGDDLRPGQQQQVVVALQVMAFRHAVVAAGAMGMVVATRETLATVIVLLQAVALDHRAHRTVDDQDPLAQGVEQGIGTIRMQPRQGGHAVSSSGLVGDQRNHFEVPALSTNLRSSLSLKPRLTWP